MPNIDKYVVLSPAIGLVLGGIVGLLYGLITKSMLSSGILYGGVIGACAGYGFRSDYNKKHKK